MAHFTFGSPPSFVFLFIVCFLAAFVDAIAGGGGLISVPGYLMAGFPPHLALGTNKFSASIGTLASAWKFAAEKKIYWSLVLPIVPFTAMGAVLGVRSVLKMDQQFLIPIIMVLILCVGIYTLFNKGIGLENHFIGITPFSRFIGILSGFLLGFYDGFFGPGTGSFLIFIMVGYFKFDFVTGNGNAKILNLTSGLFSLLTFGLSGSIHYLYGIPAVAAMILGGYAGSKFAIKKKAAFIKPFFICMSLAVVLKMIFSYLKP